MRKNERKKRRRKEKKKKRTKKKGRDGGKDDGRLIPLKTPLFKYSKIKSKGLKCQSMKL